ncbi:MAG: DUF1772 domain-containing protein [Acidobacteriaceae bacterium]|nr:DUF1772 domain-containing protein [Acidobacteriaceae bacterium]MBV9035835.1 DUF1772 domain-containing protein [Acidobacteriaceae bacterium]
MPQLLEMATTACAALLIGNELAVAAFVHPTLAKLPDMVHATAAKALAYLLGRVMPFWYALVLVLTIGEALWHRPFLQAPGLFFSIASALWALSIVYTILGPVPINNRIASWNLNHLPENWRQDRERWDGLHRLRVILLFVALVFQLLGASHRQYV